eukprot:jgi/Mesvir1/27453/Mv07237-RA.1
MALPALPAAQGLLSKPTGLSALVKRRHVYPKLFVNAARRQATSLRVRSGALAHASAQVSVPSTRSRPNLNEIDEIGHSPLAAAVDRADRDMVQLLIRTGADVNAAGRHAADDPYRATPLRLAVEKENPDIVQLLVQAGADVAHEESILYAGLTRLARQDFRRTSYNYYTVNEPKVLNDYLDTLNALLNAGADPNSAPPGAQDTPLTLAISKCARQHYSCSCSCPSEHAECEKKVATLVASLVTLGADVNAPDSRGCSALHHAISRGNLDMVECLLAAGADVSAGRDADVNAGRAADACPGAQGRRRYTPLHAALDAKSPAMVRMLVEAGADVGERDRYRQNGTAVHEAVRSGNRELLEAVLCRATGDEAVMPHGTEEGATVSSAKDDGVALGEGSLVMKGGAVEEDGEVLGRQGGEEEEGEEEEGELGWDGVTYASRMMSLGERFDAL